MSTIIDTQKIKAVALYILQQTGPISFIHLWKILYFAEMKHISRYGRPITDDVYVAMPKGPVPSILCDAKNGNAYSEISSSLEIKGYNINGTERPDMDELSKSDIKCLSESIQENLHKSPEELSTLSHGTAYKNARAKNLNKKNNPIDWIDIAVEAGAPSGMIEYIHERQDIHRQLANDSQFC